MRRRAWPALVLILAAAAPAAAQISVAAGRTQYAAADYEAALTTFDAVLAGRPEPHDRQAAELYRTFCLLALGQGDEAREAIDEMVVRDPLYRPDMDEVPPRLRAAFTEARQRLLPPIIQERYAAARAAFERGEHRAATDGFTQVLIALSDPDVAPLAERPPLADLRMLASGFNDLTIKAMAAPAPAAAPPAAADPAATAAAAEVSTAVAFAGTGAATAAAPERTSGPAGPADAVAPVAGVPGGDAVVYGMEAADVTPPAVIRQHLPSYPGKVVVARTGVLEVVIDATGTVESAEILEPVDPGYHRLVLAAVKEWSYRPATRHGVAVKYRKRVQIAVTPAR